MKKISEKIIFFGSGPVAARSLELLAKDFEVEAVVTKPKPAHHRGNFPVLDVAATLNLPVHTVSNRTDLSNLVARRPFQSRVAVLIDFGIIVDQDVIDYFPLGIVNSHFSLLPEWRGADPITFALLSGQDTTGVSLMLLVEKMDEGPLLATAPYTVSPTLTGPALTDALIEVSNQTLAAILPLYVAGSMEPRPQDISQTPTYSHKLAKRDGDIDWTKPAVQLEREIRAYLEWPKSQTSLGGKDVILTQAQVVAGTGPPGEILEKKQRLVIATGEQALEILGLKPAGKREMAAAEFLAGYKV